jgi:hypothetical protein
MEAIRRSIRPIRIPCATSSAKRLAAAASKSSTGAAAKGVLPISLRESRFLMAYSHPY